MKIPLHIPRYRSCQTDRGRVFSRRYVRTGDISAELSTAAPSPRAVFEIGHRTEYWMSRIGDGFARHGEGKVEATISRLNVRLNKLRKCSLLVVLDDTIRKPGRQQDMEQSLTLGQVIRSMIILHRLSRRTVVAIQNVDSSGFSRRKSPKSRGRK